MLEEEKMEKQKYLWDEEIVPAYLNIPYTMLEDEFKYPNINSKYSEWKLEANQIARYYEIYKKGSKFISEGSNGEYIPSDLRYKKAAMILNKEARFQFSNPPTITVNKEDVDTKYKDENAILQSYLDKVFEKTNFNGKLIKGLKDCLIGKRIAIVLNFNPDSGINIIFLNSLEFIYETSGMDDSNELTKFITFYEIVKTNDLSQQRWFKKKYTKEKDGVYLVEEIYDGLGKKLETVTSRTKIKFDFIPATVVLNDGLTGDEKGESELNIARYEQYYSKLANADMDSQRKTMNPIKYTIDASEQSTKNLSSSPGSYWDLQSDDEKAIERQAKVGTLEAQMTYSEPLKITLDRIESEMYAELDVPNLNNEQLAGMITSGKTIKALYWGLTVRCDEKMLAWSHSLMFIATGVIEGGKLYPDCIKKYTQFTLPDIPYTISVENNYPLPEDVNEEKTMDIAEVDAKVRSRKSYLKKWRGLNDDEAEEEIRQIKYENELLDDSYLSSMYNKETSVDVDYEDESKKISLQNPVGRNQWGPTPPEGSDDKNL